MRCDDEEEDGASIPASEGGAQQKIKGTGDDDVILFNGNGEEKLGGGIQDEMNHDDYGLLNGNDKGEGVVIAGEEDNIMDGSGALAGANNEEEEYHEQQQPPQMYYQLQDEDDDGLVCKGIKGVLSQEQMIHLLPEKNPSYGFTK